MIEDVVRIDRRFNGPATSGNGGYTCGVAAAAVDGAAVVRLHVPPPLDVPLERHVDVTRGAVHALRRPDGTVVATARPFADDLEAIPCPDAAAVDAAIARFDRDAYAATHPFDHCFTCGPARDVDDGLRIFPAPVDGTPVVVWRWTPSARDAGPDGLVVPPVLWAALDCPSGQAWMGHPDDPCGPAVLGELAVRIDDRPRPGEPTVVAGWPTLAEGRRRSAGSAVWSADGRLLAVGAATWIVLSEDQLSEFGAG